MILDTNSYLFFFEITLHIKLSLGFMTGTKTHSSTCILFLAAYIDIYIHVLWQDKNSPSNACLLSRAINQQNKHLTAILMKQKTVGHSDLVESYYII